MSIVPLSGQRGTELDVTFRGERLFDSLGLITYEPGILLLSVTNVSPAEVKARLKVQPDARLGQHVIRLHTAGGISDARIFSVGQYPVIVEQEPNNDFAAPQKISIDSTVHGVADSEDIDYYQLERKKGQRITAEVEAIRLGASLVDCYVAILDSKRFELSACDDSSFALQDPVVSIIAPEDGIYTVAVRESSYAGNGSSRYCLHVGEAPRPIAVYPPGGMAGDEVELNFIGDVAGSFSRKVKLPERAVGDFNYYLTNNNQSVPSPNRLRVVSVPNVLEIEPNNSAAEASTNTSNFPVAFNGTIGQAGDRDFFSFTAKANVRFDVRCVARGIRSPLDPVLGMLKQDGTVLAENDDAGGPDSSLSWTVPADGAYLVSVRDHLDKGGSNYTYRIEFTEPQPALTLSIPEFARNSQERNSIPVPKNNRFGTVLRVSRGNFSGDVVLHSPALPPGVSMLSDIIPGNVNEVPVVFEASPDAAPVAQLCELVGRHLEKTNISGGFSQSIDLVFGEPNNTVYYKTVVDRAAIAVTEEVPFSIKVVEPKVPLVQSGSLNLKVVAERKDGFKAPIQVRLLWTPPGVGSQNEITIPEGQTEAAFSLNASGDAATRTWKLALVASGDFGKGPVWVSSQLFPLTVGPPLLAMQIPMAAAEQGTNASILCKLQHLQPFEGEAVVQIHGLPPKVQLLTNILHITKESQEVIFQAAVAPDAPVGQHKTLFCQVTVTRDGEPILHNIGAGGTLRIDPPPPKPSVPTPAETAPKPAVPEPVATTASPAKPLSRLEKLRQDAKQQAANSQQ